MDYREHFAHLLEHMVRKVNVPCERHCPVQHHEDGSTEYSYGPRDNYEGPSIENLFVALKKSDMRWGYHQPKPSQLLPDCSWHSVSRKI